MVKTVSVNSNYSDIEIPDPVKHKASYQGRHYSNFYPTSLVDLILIVETSIRVCVAAFPEANKQIAPI